MTTDNRYLVLGARGLVGGATVQAAEAAGFRVLALSRNPPDFELGPHSEFVRCDLTDRDECRQVLGGVGEVSHLVYAALKEQPDLVAGWRDPDQIETNTRMLENVLDFVQPSHHLTLLQGTKAYGAHLAPMQLPGKESQPRHPGENFYWTQEDLVRERATGWSFSVVRPQIVCGPALGSPMNMVMAIGVYAAVMRKLGRSLCFPGGGGFVTEATDADLLARAILWCGAEPACAGEAFNVTNGDVLEWESLFPALADLFGMQAGDPSACRLREGMPAYAATWDEIVAEHDLKPYTMAQLIGDSWQFADAAFGYGGNARSTLLSTIKIREFGFPDCIDTAAMFAKHIRVLQDERILPL
ncbi:MAG: hypothetical protein CMQ49_11950 [Gammaproteobacteria bacterium]|nr:hypothetical protein [Gammaproteobacteria bacterium]